MLHRPRPREPPSARYTGALTFRWLQAVISILEQKPCDPGKAARAVVEALDYFAVQDSIWPAGLLVLKRQIYSNKLWLDRDCEAAIDIVQQITKLVLEIAAEAYPRPTEKSTGKEPVGVFYIKSRDERNSEYLIEQCSGDEGHSGSLPTTLAEAIVQAGKHDHLEVQFRVHRFQDRDGVSRIVHRIAVHTCHA